eukprot:4859264-Alexandrium_andersonii.AAC.1
MATTAAGASWPRSVRVPASNPQRCPSKAMPVGGPGKLSARRRERSAARRKGDSGVRRSEHPARVASEASAVTHAAT